MRMDLSEIKRMEDQDRTLFYSLYCLIGKAKFMIANVLAATLTSYV
jgi:hypothetical protein